MDGLVL